MAVSLQIHASIAPIHDRWLALWREAGGSAPFLHPGWHQAFLDAQTDPVAPALLTASESDRLLAVLPLRRDRDGVLRPLTAPRADYDDILLAPGAQDDALAAIADHLMRERFDLGEVPQASPLIPALTSRGAQSTPAAHCPGITLDPASVHDVTRRESVRRHEKKLARLGPVALHPVAAADLGDCLREMIDQHIARWLATGSESLFFDEANVAFYEKLVTRPDFAEFGRFDVLTCGERRVAYHLGLSGRGVFIWYKPSFDLNLMAHGPGEVLMKHLIVAAAESGAAYFDFTRGNESFKTRFANAATRNVRLYHRRPLLPRVRGFTLGKWRRVRRLLGEARHRLQPVRERAQLFFELTAPDATPADLAGFATTCGPVDLVAFGAASREVPGYISPARMRSAVERARRGDTLLTVRRVADGQPVHFSWLRLDEGAIVGDVADCPVPNAGRVAVIFDCWTSPDCRGQGLYPWAIRRLAAEATARGLAAWIYCYEQNTASRRGIEKAGVSRQIRLTGRDRA